MKHLTAALCAVLLAGCNGAAPRLYEGLPDRVHAPVEVVLVRITPEGLVPAGPVTVVDGQGSVAFLNEVDDRLVTVVVPDGSKLSHLGCSFTTGFHPERSKADPHKQELVICEPLQPGAAASLCVHGEGTLPLEIHGLKSVVPLQLKIQKPEGSS